MDKFAQAVDDLSARVADFKRAYLALAKASDHVASEAKREGYSGGVGVVLQKNRRVLGVVGDAMGQFGVLDLEGLEKELEEGRG